MSLQKVKILSGFDIYQKKYESTNKTNYFSWLTNYLDSDITNTTFKSDDKYDIVEMDVLHKNINTKLKIKINSLNNFIFESDNKEIENIINQIKCKYNNLYDILLLFSKLINLDNESYNEEYLEEIALTDPKQLIRMCTFLTLDAQIRKESLTLKNKDIISA